MSACLYNKRLARQTRLCLLFPRLMLEHPHTLATLTSPNAVSSLDLVCKAFAPLSKDRAVKELQSDAHTPTHTHTPTLLFNLYLLASAKMSLLMLPELLLCDSKASWSCPRGDDP